MPLALATGSAVLAGALCPVRQTRWCQLPVLMLCRPPVVVAELAAMEAVLHRVMEEAFGCDRFPLVGGRTTLDSGGLISV